ncbi:hypothetical protein L2Y96_18165 [Luteibacter aegosomaticola]|uniref:hypothetical protein n=1 Tax=Luteibacter aegosomaticola TaxID=2911538 RepID=UPI001FF8B37D|nr:hypothetical protein [Luteibacter aegosomaticola]UPG89304.1 hypothetical protein L2Y96_18165 [Luteibacter aegosomaticola]
MSRIERRIAGAITWWQSAPIDEKAAVALLVLPLVLVLIFASVAPAHPLPAPVR